jgi:hypothetical protein
MECWTWSAESSMCRSWPGQWTWPVQWSWPAQRSWPMLESCRLKESWVRAVPARPVLLGQREQDPEKSGLLALKGLCP